MMSEQIYKDNFSALSQSRRTILEEMSGVRDELASKPTLPLEKLVDGVIKLVEDLDFSNKKQIIQKVVTKVIATKKEVTVWGHIPVLATEKASANAQNDDINLPNQSNIGSNLSEVGLNASNRYTYCVTQQPFELKLQMPPTNRGRRGYSDDHVRQLQKELAE